MSHLREEIFPRISDMHFYLRGCFLDLPLCRLQTLTALLSRRNEVVLPRAAGQGWLVMRIKLTTQVSWLAEQSVFSLLDIT